MMMDDELFARAARKAAGQMLEELPSGEQPEHQFSETFEKKMEKMLRSQRRPQWQRSLGRISRRAAHGRTDGGHKPGYPAVIVINEGKLWHGGRLPACPNLVQAKTLIFRTGAATVDLSRSHVNRP